MVYVIRDSNPSIQIIYIAIWVFTYSMEYLHNHKYKWNWSHIKWTKYMSTISSTIYLGEMQTTITRNSRHSLLAKNTWSNLHQKQYPNLRVQPLLLLMVFIFTLIWMLGVAVSIDEITMRFKSHHADKKWWCKKKKVMDYRHMLFVRKYTHIKYLYAIILCKNIYLSKSMFPLQARVMPSFNTVEEKYHQCEMYNIYNSGAFSKAVYNHEKHSDSWCYKERNERHPTTCYTRWVEVKEGAY